MTTTFNKLKKGQPFIRKFANGRTISYIKIAKEKAEITALDYYSCNADRMCIGNTDYIDPYQLVIV